MACVCLSPFAYERASTEGYRKGSEDNPHQSPTQKEMGEKDGGWKERWRSSQEAASGEEQQGVVGGGQKRMNGWRRPGWL